MVKALHICHDGKWGIRGYWPVRENKTMDLKDSNNNNLIQLTVPVYSLKSAQTPGRDS